MTCEPHTEVGQIARQYNSVLARVNDAIHRREQLLQDLTASETRKSAILDAVLDCIITIDHHGKVLEFNPAAERTFGRSRRMAIGRRCRDVLHKAGELIARLAEPRGRNPSKSVRIRPCAVHPISTRTPTPPTAP